MRPVLVGMAVVAALAMSLVGANADEDCGDGLFQRPCLSPEEESERADKAAETERIIEVHEQEDREIRADAAEADAETDAWADTYLAAEKAVAVYWRDVRVDHDFGSAKRTGRLGTPDGQFISYTCDDNYEDARSGGCVPADRDYDCGELQSWGIVNIPVRPPIPIADQLWFARTSTELRGDWMLLDDEHDGIGCEFQPH